MSPDIPALKAQRAALVADYLRCPRKDSFSGHHIADQIAKIDMVLKSLGVEVNSDPAPGKVGP